MSARARTNAFSALRSLAWFIGLASSTLACASSDWHVDGAAAPSSYVEGFDGKARSPSLGSMRLREDVCRSLDTKPVDRPLDESDFVAFLKTQKLDSRLIRARSDLVFVDVMNAGTKQPIRFRVAILGTPGAAGHELHGALLEHGEGSWGLQRGNLALLAPNAPLDDIVVMASKLHLACWGVLMVAGHDDTYVVPGGYTEL